MIITCSMATYETITIAECSEYYASLFYQSPHHSHKVNTTMYSYPSVGFLLLKVILIQCILTQSQKSNCLEDFKLSELLRLKHSMEIFSCSVEDKPQVTLPPEAIINSTITTSLSTDRPSALPLTNARSHSESWKEKPSKLQTLFQVSITALAFLSFGGYLLCLIVQAIKSKGTTYFHPVATATTTTNIGQLKKIKIYRRSRRVANDSLRKEVNYGYDLAAPNPEDLYKTLLYFAEGYASSAGSFK